MRRSKGRFSRSVAVVLIAGMAVGVYAGVRKLRSAPRAAAPLAAVDTGPASAPLAQPPAPAPKADVPVTPPTRPVIEPVKPAVTPVTPKIEAPVPSVPLSGNPLPDARNRFDAGDLVAARRILSDALAADRLGTDAPAARELLTKIGQQMVFSPRIFKDDPHAAAYVMQSGDRLQKIAATHNVTWELLCRVNGIVDARKVRALQTIKLVKGPFHAVISKKKFTMDIYLGSAGGAGSVFVMSFPVGLGKDDSTPVGTWQVAPHGKLKNPTYYSPRGEGVIAADDPKNPLGEYWIGLVGVEGHALGKPSYGIHGTIDAASIGREESMGCIRLRNEDVALVFEMLVEGKSNVVVRE